MDGYLLIGESVAHGGEVLAELLGVQVASVVLVEALERLQDLVLGVGSWRFRQGGDVDGDQGDVPSGR